jgi:extracellular factor (EF) 3-hydroxypalmitic acid methyl ester biosynthesis protein
MLDQFEEIRKARRKSVKRTKCRFEDSTEGYTVYDLSVKGFSFLCEKNKCFFDKDMQLNTIVFEDAEGKKIIEASGTVVYAKYFDHENMKVGVSFVKNKILHSILGKIRAPRYVPTIQMDASLRSHEGKNDPPVKGFVADYTPSSTRLKFPDALPIHVELGDSVNIVIESRENILLEDMAHVIRKKSDNTELILQFSEKFLDVPYIETISEAINDQTATNEYLEDMHQYDDVTDDFKALVSDWRMYLVRLKYKLDAETIRNKYKEHHEQVYFLKGVETQVMEDMFKYIQRLNDITDGIKRPRNLKFKKYFRENMDPFLRAAPFVASVIDKDRGYAGNYEIIKQLFDNPYRGDTLFAKIINRLTLNLDAVTAHQDRIDFLYNTLESMYGESSGPFSFFVLGSGPGEEILRFVDRTEFTTDKPVHAALLDMDAFALVDFQDQIQYLDVNNFDLTTLNRNLLNIIAGRDEDPLDTLFPLTYCAGMFDYFSDRACKKIIEYMMKHTEPGGTVIVTNVHKDCFSRAFMDYGGEWELLLRDEQEMIDMVPEGHTYDIQTDEKRANIYLKIYMK